MLGSLLEEPLVIIFLILFLGSAAGQVSIKGVSLGTSGVLLVAMVFGHFGYEVSKDIQQLGLSLFIVAVGLQAGPRFFRMMRSKGLVFGVIGVAIVLSAAIATILVGMAFDFSPAISIGLMTGALTSTPGLAAALQATGDPLASVAYGIAYPFGVIAVILFVQLVPRFLRVDVAKELQNSSGPVRTAESPELMAIEVTNPAFHKRMIRELPFKRYQTVTISRVIRGNRNIIALNDTVILKGDYLVSVGLRADLESLCDEMGRKVEAPLENWDHVKFRRITVEWDEIIGKSLKELSLRSIYGVTVTRIERGGFEFNQHPKWRLERGDILTMVSSEERLNRVEKIFSRRNSAVTDVHILSLSLILLIGVLVGMIPLHLPGLGTMTLGVAGGPLFMALIIGHFGRLGPIKARYYQPSTRVVRDLGLVLFLAGAGTTAGQGIVDIILENGISLLFAGAIITVVPLVTGYLVSRKLFKLSMAHSLGALCGGMTSTPGLGSVNQLVDSEEPAVAYAAAYPFALIFVSFLSQVLVFFL